MLHTPKISSETKAFYRIRTAIGIFALLLPTILIIGGFFLEPKNLALPSLSDYFFSPMRDVFSGGLIMIGGFLMFYKGYETPFGITSDNFLTTIAGILLIFVTFFPIAGCDQTFCTLPQKIVSQTISTKIHNIAAISFFSISSYLCIINFRMTSKKSYNKDKRHRNKIYLYCGCIIALCVVLLITEFIISYKFATFHKWSNSIALVLSLETICIWAFAISFLTKGRADKALLGRPLQKLMHLI